MKYRTLATVLSLALGGGIAYADNNAAGYQAPQQQQQTSDTTTTTTTTTDTSTEKVTVTATTDASQIPSVDLLFETSSAVLTADAHAKLEQLAQWGKCTPKGALILEGHADPRGTQNYNLKLSAERAAMVRKKLIAMGVPSDRVVLTIYGKNGPRRASFAEDRRVTVRAGTRPLQPTEITAQK
jgi:outer membrane protein OmpA-like peptidoglycan-associated protein